MSLSEVNLVQEGLAKSNGDLSGGIYLLSQLMNSYLPLQYY